MQDKLTDLSDRKHTTTEQGKLKVRIIDLSVRRQTYDNWAGEVYCIVEEIYPPLDNALR
jgi:hypothetical protein